MLPGARLRQAAARYCGERAMTRLIDPVIADLQMEYKAAVRAGRVWYGRWIWMTGCVAFFKVIVWYGSQRARAHMNELIAHNRHAAMKALAICITATALSTAGLSWMSLHASGASGRADAFRLALYLVPQAFPLSITVGVALAAMWACGRRQRQQAPRGLVLGLALAASVASFPTLAWVAPTANQAFRVSLAGRPIPKGINELSLGELQRRLSPPPSQSSASSQVRSLQWSYHRRLAVACAPVALAVFALTLVRRGGRSRFALPLAGAVALSWYFVSPASIGSADVPPFAAAWAPNVTLLAVSIAVRIRSLLRAP